ncbi:hypothetical protein BC777_1083 [Yoonia maricola]|uniref:DUF1737 domain-containing protein n=1 Tax=Yoonia maricola TaxID=420999 RepID=A0A2M8WMT3_9RHOB|nr:hypothetical protein [Yoonia maricola]PJI92238.1 hypothetical protein BC777_1083 [Yoonia maricola]
MLQYKVVFALTLEELVDDVTTNCRENWVPQGGVSRGPLGNGLLGKKYFFQAMTKTISTN